jgi:hypothetical protein
MAADPSSPLNVTTDARCPHVSRAALAIQKTERLHLIARMSFATAVPRSAPPPRRFNPRATSRRERPQ